jgi:DNA-binding XRE family transcriptional regulator
MLAVVKMPRTKSTLFEIRGNIPKRILDYLKKDYTVELENDDDEEYVIITETDWYKNIKASMTPGDNMKIYRENAGLSQAELGEKLGGLSRHKVSDYESGRRTIGIELAKKLSKVFNRPVEYFI